MIPWRRHDCLTMDSRKFGKIPAADRMNAFGMYERLNDLIGQWCPWDSLVGSDGSPWDIDEIASKCFLEPEEVRRRIDLLANAKLIDPSAWREKDLVQIPMLIVYAADWFRRQNARLVEEHYLRHGIPLESGIPKGVRRGPEPVVAVTVEPAAVFEMLLQVLAAMPVDERTGSSRSLQYGLERGLRARGCTVEREYQIILPNNEMGRLDLMVLAPGRLAVEVESGGETTLLPRKSRSIDKLLAVTGGRVILVLQRADGFEVPPGIDAVVGASSDAAIDVKRAPGFSVHAQTTLGLSVDPVSRTIRTVRTVRNRRKKREGAAAPRNRIGFDVKTGQLTGILDDDVTAWKAAYPLVNVEAQLPRVANYLRDHESRDISATIRNWLKNEQDDAEAGRGPRRPLASPPPRSKERWAGRGQGRVR